MKALTIKQPWATLIIAGHKKYEFRTWQTKYRGKILIHAGMSANKEYLLEYEEYNLDYIKGAIIGEATLVDCILVDEEFNQELYKMNPTIYGNNHVGIYAWKLENVIKYKEPIYTKGQLGLWNYNKNVLDIN